MLPKTKTISDMFVTRSTLIQHNQKHLVKSLRSHYIFLHGTIASRGVCAIINKNFKCDITEVISDTEGRWFICNLKTEETQFSLVNVYAPNMDDSSFFKQLFTQIENKGLENIIMGGF